MAGGPVTLAPGDHELKRALGPIHLIALGIGAIIGAGIFVLTGQAAATYAGPGVVWSFAIAGTGCLFAGLCYAEYAAMIPVAGSAYTYTYATMGRFLAWIIGWNLVLEYLAAGSTVAVGWSGYFSDLMARQLHIPLDWRFTNAPMCLGGDPSPCPHAALSATHILLTGAWFNVPAVALVALVTVVLIVGVNMSANFNNLMVAIKLSIVLLVIFVCFGKVVPANHTPMVPPNMGTFGQFGWSGVFRATGVIFFAYIGFDAVSVAAQEARRPQRDVPFGILGSLLICTVLYMVMSWVLTGIAPYATLNVAHPVSQAVESLPSTMWLAPYVNVGAIVGLASVVLVLLLGQSRIFYAMAKDGMIPPVFCEIHPRFRTPWRGSLVTGAFCAPGCRPSAASHSGRTRLDRHARSLCHRLRRRDGVARAEAEFETAVPHAACLGRGTARDCHVPVHDGVSAARHLDPARRVDSDRTCHLRALQHPSRQADALLAGRSAASSGIETSRLRRAMEDARTGNGHSDSHTA